MESFSDLIQLLKVPPWWLGRGWTWELKVKMQRAGQN